MYDTCNRDWARMKAGDVLQCPYNKHQIQIGIYYTNILPVITCGLHIELKIIVHPRFIFTTLITNAKQKTPLTHNIPLTDILCLHSESLSVE